MFAKTFPTSDNIRGSLLMLVAMGGFSVGDAFVKFVSGELPLSQILVVRGFFAILFLLIITISSGQMRPISSMSKPLIVRVLSEVGAAYFFLTALVNMPFANAMAILQAMPLTVTVGAAIFFREPVGIRRISAILVGLLGVLLIIQPGYEGFTVYSLLCLASVACATLRDLATRKLDHDVPTFFVSLITVICVTILGGFLSIFEAWQPVTVSNVTLLAIASLFMMTGLLGIIGAMRVGEVAVVTPFRYFVLLFAIIIGFFLFDEIPNLPTIAGSIIVIASGIYTIYREQKLARKITTGMTHAAEQ